MTALWYWVAACSLVTLGTIAGLPLPLVVLVSAPFSALAGWYLVQPIPPSHVCGWCGRRFGGPYEWVCQECESVAQ
jgi:hypothetical protein